MSTGVFTSISCLLAFEEHVLQRRSLNAQNLPSLSQYTEDGSGRTCCTWAKSSHERLKSPCRGAAKSDSANLKSLSACATVGQPWLTLHVAATQIYERIFSCQEWAVSQVIFSADQNIAQRTLISRDIEGTGRRRRCFTSHSRRQARHRRPISTR
jgi:hypothetical protein